MQPYRVFIRLFFNKKYIMLNKPLYILLILCMPTLYFSTVKAQNAGNFEVELSFPGVQSLIDQKNHISFFRDFFGTNNCKYDIKTNSYKISTIHKYNSLELSEKLKKQNNYPNIKVTIIKVKNTNDNSQL